MAKNSNGNWTCPYCNAEIYEDDNRDFYEEGHHQVDCPECEKKCIVTTWISVDHYSKGSCELNNEMPHVLYKEFDFGGGAAKFECRKCKADFYDHDLPGGKYPKLKEGDFVMEEKNV